MTEKYISVNAFISTLKEMQKEFSNWSRSFGKTATCVLEETINKLQSFPTVDAALVVHAHWIHTGEYLTNSDGKRLKKLSDLYVCRRCHRVEALPEPYCNCGAQMDEEIEEDA